MPKLDPDVREARRIQFAGRWASTSEFRLRRQGICSACNKPIKEGATGVYARWEGVGFESRLVHSGDCINKLPPKVAEGSATAGASAE